MAGIFGADNGFDDAHIEKRRLSSFRPAVEDLRDLPEFHKEEKRNQAKMLYLSRLAKYSISPEEKKAQAAREVAEQIRLYEKLVAVPALLLMPDSKMMQARRRRARAPARPTPSELNARRFGITPPRARALSLSQRWDVVTVFALFFTAIVTPYEARQTPPRGG